MFISKDFGDVRIVSMGSPFEVMNDLRVEALENGQWKMIAGFNTLSDDYAYTNANEAVIRYQTRKLMGIKND